MRCGLIARRLVVISLFHGHSPRPSAFVGLWSLGRPHGTHSQHTRKIKICLPLFSNLNSKLTFLALKSLIRANVVLLTYLLNMFFSTLLFRWFAYVPGNKTKTLGPWGFIMPRLPGGTRSLWTCVIPLHSFRTKLKSHFFTVDWLIFFRSPFMYFIIVAFSPCAPTWCLLAGAYKCLNWIEYISTWYIYVGKLRGTLAMDIVL